MRRKYFVRGMGLGILITTIVFSIVLMFKSPEMSRSEIIDKAISYGMVMPESGTMDADSGSGKDNSDTGNPDSENPEANAEDAENTEADPNAELPPGENEGADVTVENLTGDEVTPAPNETTSPVAENAASPGGNQNQENTGGSNVGTTESAGNIISFTIRSGENSSIVGANLYVAGLVSNAREFDSFLEQNGYDRVLRVGTYDIRKGSSYETIARKITGN